MLRTGQENSQEICQLITIFFYYIQIIFFDFDK
jgi:hypothetical protein